MMPRELDLRVYLSLYVETFFSTPMEIKEGLGKGHLQAASLIPAWWCPLGSCSLEICNLELHADT